MKILFRYRKTGRICLLLALQLLIGSQGFAQKTPVEVFGGHQATNIQMIFNQQLPNSKKVGFFSIINLNMPYDKTDAPFRYYTVQANLTYSVSPSISFYTGVFSNKFDYGPSVGILARFKIKNGFILLNNRHSYGEEYVTALLGLVEYQPPINEKWKLYFRVQVLTETNLQIAKRNFQMLRLGVAKDGYQIGLATTFDQFGNQPITRNNYGLFFRVLL